jgi:hypothetical protein
LVAAIDVSRLRFSLHTAGVLAPGLGSLEVLLDAARRSAPLALPVEPLTLPAPSALPPNERRRASRAVRLALACVEQAMADTPFDAGTLRSVFATDEGTGEICQQMLDTLATTRQVSPLVFPNSVHNAPSGYFSIAYRNRQPAAVVSLGEDSFASGLLCALTEARAGGEPVLLVAYDPALTAPLDELLPLKEPLGTAWVLSATDTPVQGPVLGRGELVVAPAGDAPALPWRPGWLPEAWAHHSSARALAALGLLTAPAGTALTLPLGGLHLTLTLGPLA